MVITHTKISSRIGMKSKKKKLMNKILGPISKNKGSTK